MGRNTPWKTHRSLDGTLRSSDEIIHAKPSALGGKVLTPMEVRSRIQRVLEEHDYDPVRELVQMATAKSAPSEEAPHGRFIYDADMRFNIHRELLNYVAPKLKSLDVAVQAETQVTINVIKFGDTDAGKEIAERAAPEVQKQLEEAIEITGASVPAISELTADVGATDA